MKSIVYQRLALLMWLLATTSGIVIAQRRIVGKVTDERGSPLLGVTVYAEGTSITSRTDTSGGFEIVVPKNRKILIFSCIGFLQQKLSLGPSDSVKVILHGSILLNEVVITALNITRSERSVPYAIQSIGENNLNPIGSEISLAGKIAGMAVSTSSDMKLNSTDGLTLRGIGSLAGSRTPLVVVDGTPVNFNSISDINSENVESITVLKGPSAAALFGQRGDAGALLINLKKAELSNNWNIEFNQNTVFNRASTLPAYQNRYAGGASSELIQFTWQPGMPEEWKALDGKYYHDYSDDASWGPPMDRQEYIPWYAWYPGTKYSYKTGFLTPQPDNVRKFYGVGIQTNTSLNLSKANDIAAARFSFAYQNETGLIPNTSNRKFFINSSSTLHLSKKLTLGANLNYTITRVSGEFNDGGDNQTTGSFNSWFHRDLDMDIMRELRNLRSPEGILASWNHFNPDSYLNSPESFYRGNYWFNFFSYFNYNSTINDTKRLFGDINLTYKINERLKIAGFLRQYVPAFITEWKTYDILQRSITQRNMFNSYSISDQTSSEINYEFLTSWADHFGKFSIEANFGGNIRSQRFQLLSAFTSQGLKVPDLFTLNNSVVLVPPFHYSEKKQVRSIYARGSFGWKDWVFLDWSIRNDWSSALPPNHNSYRYPSAGLSFIFSDLLKQNNILNYGKWRVSWAQVGSDLSAYRINPAYSFQNPWGANLVGTAPDVLIDQRIKPSLSSSYETGFDFRLLKSRIGISFTVYVERKINEILSVSTSSASGVTARLINAGRLDRSGLELQLNLTPLKQKAITWEVSLNFSKVQNKVVELTKGIDAQVQATDGIAISIVNAVDKTSSQLRGGGIKRINGLPVLDENGFYIQEPNKYFGSDQRDFAGGIFNTLKYKNLSLRFNIDFVKGGKFFSYSHLFGEFSGLWDQTAAINDKGKNVRDPVNEGGGVKVTGVDKQGNSVQKYVDAFDYYHQFLSNQIYEPYIHERSFVKFRELSLVYSLPLNKWKLTKIGTVHKCMLGFWA